jgi:hypothetical protein
VAGAEALIFLLVAAELLRSLDVDEARVRSRGR